jgi:hypothetical protein
MITKYVLLIIALILAFCSGVTAQTSEIPESAMQAMFEKFKQIHTTRTAQIEMENDLEKSIDEMNVKLKAWIAETKRSQEQMEKGYRPMYKHKSGEMNLFPLWEEIPGPIPSLPEAKQVNFDMKYGGYISKVEMQKKQLSDMVQDHLGDQRNSEAEVIADTKKMANQNAMVQQMGGADAIMNMSEAERKAMAKRLKDSPRTNPGAYSGAHDPGMNAMMQKMMSDPDYRNKYNNMTDAQKQAEMQKFMTNKTTERNDAAFEAGLKDRNETNASAAIQALLGKTLANMQEASRTYAQGTDLANKFYNGLYTGINNWHMKAFEALPVVVMGESREKQGLAELDKFKGSLMYMIQKKEAATRTVLWNSWKGSTKIAFGEFNDFIGSFTWGAEKNASMLNYNELQVANAVSSLYDEMIDLAGQAERLTRLHKGQQEQYEFITK